MNSSERIKAAAKGLMPDCVPVAPYIGNWGAGFSNIPISEYNTNGKNMAEAQAKAWEYLKLDTIVAQSDNYYIAEGYGVKINQPYNETPNPISTPIHSLKEVEKLPSINSLSGRMHVYIEAVSRLKEIFGNEVSIRSCGTGMFSLACHAMGTQNFLTELAIAEIDEDKEMEEQASWLMEYCTNSLILFSKALLEAGSDFIICGDSSASPDLVSPSFYKKFIFPYEKKYFDKMKPFCDKYNALSLLHICGNTTSILPDMARTGADIIEIDHKVNLAEARKIVGPNQCLMGNLDPVTVLLQGTKETVREKALKAIKDAGENGNFILGSGCEVAMETPAENLVIMRDVGHSFEYN